jgi:hypothetical protein
VIPRKHESQQNYLKIADLVKISLNMRDNKSATSPMTTGTGLNGTQLSTLKSVGINDPERLEIYKNTKLPST